jgi:hypothetical protein
MVGKSKIEEKKLNFLFYNFPLLFRLLTNITRNMALQRKKLEIAMFCQQPLDSSALSSIGWWPHFLDFLLHPANRNVCPAGICVIWAFPSGFPTPFKNCPEAIQ